MRDPDKTLVLRPPRLSGHNWHTWSVPPSARVPFDLTEPDKPKVPELKTAAETMIDLLCQMGIDTFFGLPGGPVIPIFDAILTHKNARLIEPRHETYGAFAAMGYHRASGKIPGVVVTAGPGATNVVTGVVAAHLERVPMLIICGDVPWQSGRKMFQDTGEQGVGIERMLRGVTRSVVRVAQPASAASQTFAALRAATDPRNPGPSLVVVSIDRASAKVAVPSFSSSVLGQGWTAPPPDEATLERIYEKLRDAKVPLFLIGAGCKGHEQSVAKLVEVSGIPFMTTPQAKGLLPEDHPLSLRTSGAGSSVWARRYCDAGPDVTVVLGADLDDMSLAGTPPVANDGYLIHVDHDPTVFARNLPTALGAAYEVGVFCEALAATLTEKLYRRSQSPFLQEVKRRSPFDVADFTEDEALPVAPHRVLGDLLSSVPEYSTFVTDIGEHTLFSLHYVTATAKRRFLVHQGLGSMGSGISSSIGLALGDPSRQVVCICGDGGMEMAGMEVLVGLKLRLPILYAVFNDARYNMVYHGYKLLYSREAEWQTPMVDFAKWAESLGARGYRVERPGEITAELLQTLLADRVPVVLDIRHDPAVRVSNNGRVESLKKILNDK